MQLTNAVVAKMLREVATAYTIKKEGLFQIRAYETAATNIENSSSEIKDLWEEKQLDQISGIGESLKSHLDELFRTGKVKHWEEIKKDIPQVVFDFLDIPGVGPQTALKLSKAGAKSLSDLENKLKTGFLLEHGFSEKAVENLKNGFEQMMSIKTGRMLLPYADMQAQKVLEYLKKSSDVKKADVLGSLRRMVATIGDLDFAIATDKPLDAIEYIVKMPGVTEVIEKGDTKISVINSSGLHLDFLIVNPSSYGSLLQHFTGSKAHNIHLRTIAGEKGLSLSEYGVKVVTSGKVLESRTEEDFYGFLKMQTPPPELREDTGEIEAALKYKLPELIELKDVKGDLHIHSDFNIEPSHDLGANSIKEMVERAKQMGYEYIGFSEHQPSVSKHTEKQIIDLIKRKKEAIEQINYSTKGIRVLNLLELDIMPDGSFSVPEGALRLLDFALAGIHSVHHQSKDIMTKRILKALENPYVKVLTHPTGRLLNERGSSEADWDKIFEYAGKHGKAMEISAYPNRLDLSDHLVRLAKGYGVKFVINTDSHEISQMNLMGYGVSVARRGWASKEDIINANDWTKLKKWFNIKV